MRLTMLVMLAALAAGLSGTSPRAIAQSSVIVDVSAGDMDRANVPITLTLPDEFRGAAGVYVQQLDTGQEIVAQRGVADATLTWLLQDRLPRGQSRRYRVIARQTAVQSSPQVRCRDTGQSLEMELIDSRQPVLTYHTSTVLPPRGIDAVFQRSGFIHPLRTPTGRVVTADFPADHAHQHGIFFAWKQAEFEGRAIDFWNQADRTGLVEHTAVQHVESGPVYAQFEVSLRHLDLTASDGPKPVLDEDWTVRLYALADVHVVDLTSRQRCASASPLKLLEYHYGGMGYRGPTEWLGTDSGFEMTTNEGLGRIEGNHSRPLWVDCLGPLDSAACGIRVVQHPDNFRFPQPVRLHPSKPYFVFAPEVLGEFVIEPEQEYESRYRYIVFDSAPSSSVMQLANAYVTPPQVRIIE